VLLIKQLEATSRDNGKFGLCPCCGKPLSQMRDRQIAWFVNSFCLFFTLAAMAVVWYVRDPSPFYTVIEPLRHISRMNTPSVNTTSPNSRPFSGTVQHNTRSVTFQQYLQLKRGMRYREVSHIMGSKGTLTSRTRDARVLTQVYHWQNPNGSNLSVEFRRSKLAVKARFKLEPSGAAKR
jgi:hypothetical protein